MEEGDKGEAIILYRGFVDLIYIWPTRLPLVVEVGREEEGGGSETGPLLCKVQGGLNLASRPGILE